MTNKVQLIFNDNSPEVETMLNLLFGDKTKTQATLCDRKELEAKVISPSRTKEDCLEFIAFELRLMKVIRILDEKKKTNEEDLQLHHYLLQLHYLLRNRLHKFYQLAVCWFREDIPLWISYIKFCKETRLLPEAHCALQQLLEVHGSTTPELYKQAAIWELKDSNDTDKAREYLLNGIHEHNDCKMLFTEVFKLELLAADRKRNECQENGELIDETNPSLTEKRAEAVYNNCLKKFKDIDLLNELINICSQYDFAMKLEGKIYTEMMCDHVTDERLWEIIARRELTAARGSKLTPKVRIEKCVALYETAVTKLNTPRMWKYYLDTLWELISDSLTLPNYKKKVMFGALRKASSANMLTETHYLIWVSLLDSPEKRKRMIEVLHTGVDKIPKSQALWHTLLRAHMMKGEDRQVSEVFEKAIEALGSKSLPFWKLVIQYEQLKRNNKVEDLYRRAVMQCSEISDVMKPEYLEWIVLHQSIVAARRTYDMMCDFGPPCLEMHKQMVELESIQPFKNKKRIRHCYNKACEQFGVLNVDVWMDYCKFEINSGDREKVSEVYWRARDTLDPQKLDTFLTESSLIFNVLLLSTRPRCENETS